MQVVHYSSTLPMDGTSQKRSAKKTNPPKKKETSKGKKKEEKKRYESEQGAGRDPKPRATHNKSTFTVPLRQKEHLSFCFMCDDSSKPLNSEDSDYIKCGFEKCNQQMHKNCVENYSCSEYSPNQAQLLFVAKSPVCTAHFCWNCYDERSKNASRFGELADCEKCLRSFHLECVPAGCEIKDAVDGRRKKFVCHYHAPPNGLKILKSQRLKYCIDCEEFIKKNDESRVECKGCTNIFHKECGYEEVKGKGANGEDMTDGYCSFCVNGGFIVPKQFLLVYFGRKHYGLKRGYYPAEAVALSDIPPDLKLGSNFGKCGWIPVKWIWDGLDNPLHNMIHKSQVQRLTVGCEKNLPNKDFLGELKKCEKSFIPPTVTLDHEQMRRTVTIIEKNVYFEGVNRVKPKPRLVISCICEPDSVTKIKCNTKECLNRKCSEECGKECQECDDDVKREIRCANQSLQKPLEKKTYEVKLAPDNKGFGTFATETIEALDFIFEYAGEVIDRTEKESREDRMLKLRSNDEYTYMMELSGSRYIDARFKGGEARYANHSCDPNAVVKLTDVPFEYFGSDEASFEKRLKIEALRKINPGDEITLNYALDESRGLVVDECRCGAPNCTGKLGEATDDGNDLEGSNDKEKDEEKENKPKKRAPTRKTSKKNEKSEEMKKDEKTTRKRGRPRSVVSPSPGPSTSKNPVKRGKRGTRQEKKGNQRITQP